MANDRQAKVPGDAHGLKRDVVGPAEDRIDYLLDESRGYDLDVAK